MQVELSLGHRAFGQDLLHGVWDHVSAVNNPSLARSYYDGPWEAMQCSHTVKYNKNNTG